MNGSSTVINVSLFSRKRPIVISHAMRKTPGINHKQQRHEKVFELAFCSRDAKAVQDVLRQSKWHPLGNFKHFPLPVLSP
jgi:hypothetical protein